MSPTANTTTGHTAGKERHMSATNNSPHLYNCWCGCGGTVEVTFVGGFQGTTCQIKPCAAAPAYIMAFEVPRSAVLDMVPA
jgi:hypothetical protein